MNNPQCPCAKLFKIGDDYTREHHEDCEAQYRAVVSVGGGPECESTPGTEPIPLETLEYWLQRTPDHNPFRQTLLSAIAEQRESLSGAEPDDYYIVAETGTANLVTVQGQCGNCGEPFTAVGCELDTSTDPQTITGRVYCRGCEDMYVFHAEGYFA